MSDEETPQYRSPTPVSAALGFGLSSALTAAALMTLLRTTPAGFTDATALVLAFGSAALPAAIVWHHTYTPTPDPIGSALNCSARIAILTPTFVVIGVAGAHFPSMLLTDPGVPISLAFIITAHAVFLSLPVAALTGWLLARGYHAVGSRSPETA